MDEGKSQLNLEEIERTSFNDIEKLNKFYIEKLKTLHNKNITVCDLTGEEASEFINDLAFITKTTLTNIFAVSLAINKFDIKHTSDGILLNLLRILRDAENTYKAEISRIIEENNKTKNQKIEIAKS